MPTLTAGTHQLRLVLKNNTPAPITYLLVRGTVGSMLGATPQSYSIAAQGTVTATLTFSSLQPGTYPVVVEVIDYYQQVILRAKLEDVFIEIGEPLFSLNSYQFYPQGLYYLSPPTLLQVLFSLKNSSPMELGLVVKMALGRVVDGMFISDLEQETGVITVAPQYTSQMGYGINFPVPAGYPEGARDAMLSVRDTATGKTVDYVFPNKFYALPLSPTGAWSCSFIMVNVPTVSNQALQLRVNDRWGEQAYYSYGSAGWGAVNITLSGGAWDVYTDPASASLVASYYLNPYSQGAFSVSPFIPVNGASYEVDWLTRTVRRVS